jgi:hypothetical protein
MPGRFHAEGPKCIHVAHAAAANLGSFASNGFKRSSAQNAVERNSSPGSQRTETECAGGSVFLKAGRRHGCVGMGRNDVGRCRLLRDRGERPRGCSAEQSDDYSSS